MANNAIKQRVDLLLEEWKALAGYIDEGFRVLEKQSIYIVLILGAAVGIAWKGELPIPREIWAFAPFAILVLLYRLSSQVTFAFFQSMRILKIENTINNLLSEEGGNAGNVLWYGHEVRERSRELLRLGAYAYLPWLWLQEGLGLSVVVFATYRAVEEKCGPIPDGWGWVFCVAVGSISLLWAYQLVMLTFVYFRTSRDLTR